MPRPIDRRRIVLGAAWTVPAVVVASAVPAVAASVNDCPELGSADPIIQSRTGATVRLSFTGVTGAPTIQIVGISGATFNGPLATYAITGSTLDVSFTRTSNGSVGGLVTVTYILKNQAGIACGPQTSFTFQFNPNPV